ncbi:adult-specific rigid cuticular protein 15.7 [Caerostris extrusa]|uniref:Adult-specific rigid cuticular protein 15.7 n=1 Tax=Caerostris extrusa TaxID=172846 RepID=A0AAV4TTU6_CAEEX|nr:adult-specific rigid cuticular protein 15.7 [Caerostris extrusa]
MIAQIAFFCAALVSASAYAPLVNTGVSTSSRQQDDGLGGTNSRSEVGDGYGNKKGSYTIADIDGRARRVDYVADGHGFRATVKTNEPEPPPAPQQQPSSLIASPYAGPVAPVVNHIAPAAPAVAVAAPVVYGAGALGLGHGAGFGTWSRPWFGIWSWCPGLGHGAALGLGYGAGIYGAGLGKVIL